MLTTPPDRPALVPVAVVVDVAWRLSAPVVATRPPAAREAATWWAAVAVTAAAEPLKAPMPAMRAEPVTPLVAPAGRVGGGVAPAASHRSGLAQLRHPARP